jgi:hypothetical protein
VKVIRVDFKKRVRVKTPQKLSSEEYAQRDFPLKCSTCRHWMRMRPKDGRCVQRRPSPHASQCVHCKVKHPCRTEREQRCDQCRNLVKDPSTAIWHELHDVKANS